MTVALLGGLFVATFVFRWGLFPAAFFHPNGQGAFWIGFALDENGDRSPYGPGFWELFGWLARQPIGRPEHLVFGAQAVLGAACSVCAWVIAREVGGSRPVAWGSAFAVAVSPLLARMSQSQSYYGTWTSLLFLATAVLMLGCPREDIHLRRFGLAVAAAGFLVAQAARITPIGWMAAAVLPLAVAARPGPIRAQLRWAGLAAVGIGAVVAITSGSAMLGVLRGTIGTQWLPRVNPSGVALLRMFGAAQPFIMLAILGLAVHASRHRAHGALRMAALFGAIALMDATCMVRGDSASFQRAFMAMWTPVLLALAVAVVADLRTHAFRVFAATGLAAGIVVLHVSTWREERELPTNVLEASWAEEWRERLPPGSTVVYLSRVTRSVLGLPLYVGTRVNGEPFILTNEDPVPELGALGANVYYYESSLCAAKEARDFCHELRQRFGLSLVESRTLPARSSAVTSFFEAGTVQVSLFRVQ